MLRSDPLKAEFFETKVNGSVGRLGSESLIPEPSSNPIAQFGPMVALIGIQFHGSHQSPAVFRANGKHVGVTHLPAIPISINPLGGIARWIGEIDGFGVGGKFSVIQ